MASVAKKYFAFKFFPCVTGDSNAYAAFSLEIDQPISKQERDLLLYLAGNFNSIRHLTTYSIDSYQICYMCKNFSICRGELINLLNNFIKSCVI